MTTAYDLDSSLLSVEFRTTASHCLLIARGDLTKCSLPALEAQIDQIASVPHLDVVLDVTDLRRLDPAGIRVLLGIDQYVRALGQRFTVRGAGGHVAAVLAGTPLDVHTAQSAA